MAKKGLKCPKCGAVMNKTTKGSPVDPFEIKYHCDKCEATYIFHNWAEYYESCEWEQKEKEKNRPTPFNPSIKGSVMKGES